MSHVPQQATIVPTSSPMDCEDHSRSSACSQWLACLLPAEAAADPFVLGCMRMVSVLKPVLWSMVLMALYAIAMGLSTSASGVMRAGLPYRDVGGDSVRSTLLGALLNGVVLLSAIVVVTVVFVVIFAKRMVGAMTAFLVTAYFLFFLALCTVLVLRLASVVPLDWPSVAFVSLNGAAVLTALVFGPAAELPHKAALVLHSVSVAMPFAHCGEATVWTTLILLVVWDLLAVLCKYGPLRIAMEINRARTLRGESVRLPAGLIYEGYYYHLGTGDMVFFAVLAGRAWVLGFMPTLMCWAGVVAGLGVTVLATEVTAFSTLPALPASLVIGIGFMFAGRWLMGDYVATAMSAGATRALRWY